MSPASWASWRCCKRREQLPADAMNTALELHHTLVRKLLHRHGGYESATEGDSFIAAFHTPWDALAFAHVSAPRGAMA